MELFGYKIERATKPPTGRTPQPPRHAARMRQTGDSDTLNQAWGLANAFAYSAPDDVNDFWRRNDLDTQTLQQMTAAQLAEYMVDISPEISRALWDYERFCNPGYTATAMRGDEPDEAGQALLDAFIARLDDLHGDFNVVISRLFSPAVVRGAVLAELVLDKTGRVPLDLATPDPYIIRFRRKNDKDRGAVWEMGQIKDGKFDSLDGYSTIRYIPIDPFPGKPYGRALITPAFFSCLFLIGLLHDLRRVVAQQGYPRLDLEVVFQTIVDSMPPEVRGDPKKAEEWVNSTIDQVKTMYSSLEPDDAFVHTDAVKVNRPVGAMMQTTAFSAFDSLIQAIERIATRALKTIPLLMGLDRSSNETNSNREWELYVAGIKSLQHYAETTLERLFTIALQVQGSQATVKFKFAELRASEMLRDAMTEQMVIANARSKYDNGWISQDAAAEEVTGRGADVDAPRDASDGTETTFDAAMTLDGEERKARLAELRGMQAQVLEAIDTSVSMSNEFTEMLRAKDLTAEDIDWLNRLNGKAKENE